MDSEDDAIREHEAAGRGLPDGKARVGSGQDGLPWSSLGVLASPLAALPWVNPVRGLWIPWTLAAGTLGVLLISYLGDRETLRSCRREESRYAAARERLLGTLDGDPLLMPHHAEYPYPHPVATYGFDGRHGHPWGCWRLVEAGGRRRGAATDLLARQARAGRGPQTGSRPLPPAIAVPIPRWQRWYGAALRDSGARP